VVYFDFAEVGVGSALFIPGIFTGGFCSGRWLEG
jgi:hypothetical protein